MLTGEDETKRDLNGISLGGPYSQEQKRIAGANRYDTPHMTNTKVVLEEQRVNGYGPQVTVNWLKLGCWAAVIVVLVLAAGLWQGLSLQ